jgi:hypothetical protein
MFIPPVIKVPYMSVEAVVLSYAAQEGIAFCVGVRVQSDLVVVEAEETEEAQTQVVLQKRIADPAELVQGQEVWADGFGAGWTDSFAENVQQLGIR